MQILVSGSRGFIGSALVPFLTGQGHRVIRLIRATPAPGEAAIQWDPVAGTITPQGLEGLDAVVHLSGENIVGRWTAQKKARIMESRVRGTRCLAEAVAALAQPPRVLVCASAVGYYGDRADALLEETSPSGEGFLAEVCRAWEAAAMPAQQRGIRVVHLRIGMVLGAAGGALALMLGPFRLGLGGILGTGRQYVSWVSVDDVAGAIGHVLVTDSLRGAVNVVAPQPVTNAEFTRTLGRVLRRPTVFPVPAGALRLAFGEMAGEILLGSTRVRPAQLERAAYRFRHPQLEPALRDLLRRP